METMYKEGVLTIRFNRPNRKNAIDRSVYIGLTEVLNKDALDDNIVVTIITGNGEYFSSGNDVASDLYEVSSEAIFEKLDKMVNAFINYPKLLIAVVNGPAIGIGATIPGLCDIIYGSESAIFDARFVKLGLLVEAASSFTFPFNMGRS